MLGGYNTKPGSKSQGFFRHDLQDLQDFGGVFCGGAVGRAFALEGFFSMRASSETFPASAVALACHIERPTSGSVEAHGELGSGRFT